MDRNIKIKLPTDENGLAGRECPQKNCLGYFKVKFGTGIQDPDYETCFCPYCGYKGTQSEFFTQDQIKLAENVAKNYVLDYLDKEFKKIKREFETSSRGSFIKLKLDYKSHPKSIVYYAEKALETNLVCEKCKLEYAIYGKFAFCPDCGQTNSYQIFITNLNFIEKLLSQAENYDDPDFKNYLVQNALEDVVSSFDSFGTNTLLLVQKNKPAPKILISFQNISKAREKILINFGFDFSAEISEEDWNLVVKGFQKRHLISHNDGIIDKMYIDITREESAIPGRKILLSIDEVRNLLNLVSFLALTLKTGLFKKEE